MAGSTAKIEWASNDAAVARTLQSVQNGMDSIARKLDKVEASSKKASKAAADGFGQAGQQATQFVAAVTGIGGALTTAMTVSAALKKEWETLQRQQGKAADANLKLADVLPSTYRQAGGLLSGREVERAVGRISRSTTVDEVRVAQAIGEALAARGATNKQEAMGAISAAEAALRFAPEADAATIASLAGGTTDLQRRFGVSAEQSIGFLSRVGGQARVTSLREQVQNLNPAIGGLTSYGMRPDAAGGLVSVLTGATGDFTGAVSSTASLQLAKQLQDRGYATPEAGIAAMQADAALRESFFKGGRFGGKAMPAASFETRALPAIRELLTGGSPLAGNYAAATREVGSFEQGGATYRQMIEEVNQLESVRLARLKRGFSQAAGELRLGDIVGAEGAITREGLAELLDAGGAGAWESSAALTTFDATTRGGKRGRVGDVAARLRREAESRLRPTERFVPSLGEAPVDMPRPVTADDRRVADTLGRVADLLEDIARTNKDMRDDSRHEEPRVTQPAIAGFGR